MAVKASSRRYDKQKYFLSSVTSNSPELQASTRTVIIWGHGEPESLEPASYTKGTETTYLWGRNSPLAAGLKLFMRGMDEGGVGGTHAAFYFLAFTITD